MNSLSFSHWSEITRSQLSKFSHVHKSASGLVVLLNWSVHLILCHFLPSCFIIIVQSLSRVRLFVILWTTARQASLSFTISQSLLRLLSIESMIPSNHLVLCCPLFLLPSVFPSLRVFSSELPFASSSQTILASASASVLPVSIQGFFPLGLTDLFAIQRTLKSLLQHHNSKASILCC